jgi:hypothetical protein
MHKKLTASAATSLLLLGASDVAMAQETFPPFVVLSVQATADVVVAPPSPWAVRVWMPFRPCARSRWNSKEQT